MLSLRPQTITPAVWYYEEKRGISIYFDDPHDGPIPIAIIPWRKLTASMKRKATP